MKILEGKTAVITGGTRGLGLAIAKEFVNQGCCVVISGRDEDTIQKSLEQLDSGANSLGLVCDVRDLNQVNQLSEFTIQRFGGYDIWINNAGISTPYGPTIDTPPDIFRTVLETNIFGVYHGSYVALKTFLKKNRGKLINILGHGYRGPVPYQNAYASSKAWVYSFTLALAKEYKNTSIGIFGFQPGMMLTDLLLHVPVIRGYEDKLKSYPFVVKALANPPEKVAGKIAWLASTATDGQSGKIIAFSSFLASVFGFLKAGLQAGFKKPITTEEMMIKITPVDKAG